MLEIDRVVEEISGISCDDIPADVLSATEPLLLKGLVSNWPLVKAGRESVTAGCDYLRKYYKDATIGAFYGLPEIHGRVFYNDDMSGFNFQCVMVKLDKVLDELVSREDDQDAPMFYVGSTTVDTCLPGFRAGNDVRFTEAEPLASIWLGNRSRIAAHYDVPDNLACNAVGRRRFTLFPPDEIGNLYVGPVDFTPAGQAISLVDFHNPDLDRFPKFATAVDNARVANMEPGDALFVPSMWWHHVEGLEPFNVLINYWWRRTPAYLGMPAGALDHAMMTIRDLPCEQREAWLAVFRHYVFDAYEGAADHIPEAQRGVLAPMDETAARRIRAELLNKLNR
jgi:hypothetical protein